MGKHFDDKKLRENIIPKRVQRRLLLQWNYQAKEKDFAAPSDTKRVCSPQLNILPSRWLSEMCMYKIKLPTFTGNAAACRNSNDFAVNFPWML